MLYGRIKINDQILKLFSFAGGGAALLYASKELDKLQTANFDQKIGVQIIQNALKVCPSSCVCMCISVVGCCIHKYLFFKIESGCKFEDPCTL